MLRSRQPEPVRQEKGLPLWQETSKQVGISSEKIREQSKVLEKFSQQSEQFRQIAEMIVSNADNVSEINLKVEELNKTTIDLKDLIISE